MLVTRPEPANLALAQAVAAAGGEPIALPAVQTVASPREATLAALGQQREVALAIFISVPAVEHGSWLLREGRIRAHQVAAIGDSTAAALRAHGVTVAITPEGGSFTSEALLRHPKLQAGRTSGEVLIVRGHGGRELLAQTLRERRLDVAYAEVYRRQCPPTDGAKGARAAVRAAGAPQIITATSLEILDNALLLLGPEADLIQARSRVLAPSDRIAQAATKAGFQLPPLRSRGADNDALLSAMEAWWGTREHTFDTEPGRPGNDVT